MEIKTPFYYLPLGTIPGFLVTLWLTWFYASLVQLRLVYQIITKRFAFFTVKDRSGKNRPKVLDHYGTHQFVQLKKQNIKLHYVEAGDTSKQLMVFVHGFPECWFSWRHQMEAFAQHYHVVAVNMRGYGESDKPIGVRNYATDILTKDIIEFIETLTTKAQPKCVLVAHDWGGVICWNVALFAPHLVDRFIVLNAPHPSKWIARLATTWRQFFSSWYMFFFNCPILPELMTRSNDFVMFDRLFGKYNKSPEEVDVYKHYFAQPYGITAPLNYYRATLRGYGAGGKNNKKVNEVKKVQPKTLIIWGRDDLALVKELATDSAEECVDVEVKYIDNCSHWIQIDKPAEVNALMKQFLGVRLTKDEIEIWNQ